MRRAIVQTNHIFGILGKSSWGTISTEQRQEAHGSGGEELLSREDSLPGENFKSNVLRHARNEGGSLWFKLEANTSLDLSCLYQLGSPI